MPKQLSQQLHFFLLTFALFFSINGLAQRQTPYPKSGEIDLSQYDFDNEGIIYIVGEWEFYWKQFLIFTDFHNSLIKPDTIVKVPKTWNSYIINNEKISGYGFATYRLKLKTKPNLKELTFFIPTESSAFIVLLNQDTLLQIGVPTQTKKNFRAERKNTIITVPIDTSYNELIFQISNFSYFKGGMWYPIKIGTKKQITKLYDFYFFTDVILTGILLLITIFSLTLFLFRKKDFTSLFFACISFLLLARVLMMNAMVFEHFFPEFPYILAVRIEYFTFAAICAFFLLFMGALFPKAKIQLLHNIFLALSLLYVLIISTTPIYIFTSLLKIYQIIFIGMLFYGFLLIIRALKHKYKSAVYILFGFIILAGTSITDVLIANNLISRTVSIYLSPIGYFIFIVTQLITLTHHLLLVEKDKINLEGSIKTINQLNEIGLDIIANLKVERILGVIYEKVNKLLKIDNLAIGIYNQENDCLQFIGINQNHQISKSNDFLKEKSSLSVICFLKEENIIIQEYSEEYKKYFDEFVFYNNSEYYESLIYIPLKVKDKKIGVLTIQNKQKNVFNQFDLNTVQNIAIFASVALDNANIYETLDLKETKLKSILETASEAIGLFSVKGKFNYVNPAFSKITGYKLEELLNMDYINLIQNYDDLYQNYTQLINGEIQESRIEVNLVRRDGEIIMGKLSSKILKNPEDEATEILGVFTDITEIKTSYNNIALLSEIGKEITRNLSMERIIETVHKKVNTLMDANLFGIGIYNAENETLDFIGTIEDNFKLPFYSYKLSERGYLAVRCFLELQEIFSNDIEQLKKDNSEYLVMNFTIQSLIYLPLLTKENIIGVITVQSKSKNSYSENHLNLFRNIAVYVSIALENAGNYQELMNQKNLVVLQNRKILDSINYAKRIQNAIISNSVNGDIHLPETFIIFKPKDIVSGDFYWFKTSGQYKSFVAADCTGHGVPGAFMSILGISLLNEIVSITNINNPAFILSQMRYYVKKTLQQTGQIGEQQDGIDIAFCTLDSENQVLYYAGANIPLWLNRKNQCQIYEFKSDRMPIGIHPRDDKDFTNYKIEVYNGDTFYIFSDGFASQFGCETGEKLKSRRLQEIILRHTAKSMSEQQQEIELELRKWQGSWEQVDDILLIGVKI